MPTILTFLASAAWHGIEVGFLVCFTGLAFHDYANKVGEKTKIGNWVLTNVPYRVYHPFLWLYNWFIGSYLVIAFMLLRFEHFNFVHRNLYYSGHICLLLAAVIVTVLPKVSRKKPTVEQSSSEPNKKDD